MKWSQFFLPTLREAPKDAEVISHVLMLRAGLIRRLGSGSYSYLPFGLRALHKAAAIVREEMNRAGAQEVLLPALQPVELWKQTGRDRVLGDVLIRFKDRTGKEVALGPTHEEVITDVVKEINSYKQLPVMLYQIQTKFRDEPRPRAGVIRSKEFLMKDAYSFDVDATGLEASYQRMYDAYVRVFQRCGLTVIPCEADPGMMGGEASCEFMAPSENGEDRMVRCAACGYAANLEAAKCPPQSIVHSPQSIEKPKTLEAVKTPGKHTVEQVSRFLNVSPKALIKTLLYDVEKDHVAVLVRGDHEVNDAKLSRALGTAQLKLSDAKTVERISGAPLGFAGPVKLAGIRLVADHAVMGVVNAVTGANQAETHVIHVNPGRDFQPSLVADLRVATEEDRCYTCGGVLEFMQVIEAGHVFKLGTKYTQALGALFQDAQGKQQPMIMGCYGIGINRILAVAIEQRHDAAGIIWPPALAPFQVLVSVLTSDNPAAQQAAEQIVAALEQAGLEVLLDDRAQSPGSKLKDADLIGLPVQVIIGKVWQAEGKVEVVSRASKAKHQAPPSAVLSTVQALLDKAATA